jgi:uncharacterized protein
VILGDLMSIEQYKAQLIKAVEYHYPDAKIYLFGSWATGKNRPGSDIDLAIDAGEKMNFYEKDRLDVTIDNLDIPRRVDVIDLCNIKEDFKARIMQEAIAWKL